MPPLGAPMDVFSEMVIVLDSGPLGLLSNPAPRGLSQMAHDWARRHVSSGARIVIPEISDYEVRRELVRASKTHGIERLDRLCDGLQYQPLTTAVMREAAELWARARNEGHPSAHDAALDGDVLLAAQARNLRLPMDDDIIVATTNVAHLNRYVEAGLWSEI